MSEHAQPTVLVLPAWGVEWEMYERLCRYLGFTPSPALYEKLGRYLLQVAVQQPQPEGFDAWLAELRPGKTGLGILDVGTRLLRPRHAWRYRLNGLIAVHECDPRGYAEMTRGEGSGAKAWVAAASSVSAAAGNVVLGVFWLLGQYGAYLISARALRKERAYFAQATVLMTGASRGLGLALVGRLLSQGARVVAVARDAKALSRLRDQASEVGLGDHLLVATADVASTDSTLEVLRDLNLDPHQIDVAIMNAGVKGVPGDECTGPSLRHIMAVNFFGPAQLVESLLPNWRGRGRGHLIFLSSLGRLHGMVETGAYNASKAALSILAESLAMDLNAREGNSIRVTIAEPGLIRTSMIGASGLQRALSIDCATAARIILVAAAQGRVVCRFPLLFSIMTKTIALLPMGMRIKILSRVKRDQ